MNIEDAVSLMALLRAGGDSRSHESTPLGQIYTPEQARRHEVKPGITGWAQVNGRNAITWKQKFKLDLWYVENRSFLFDCRILWLTLIKVFKREGIRQKGHATMEKFKGNGESYEQQV